MDGTNTQGDLVAQQTSISQKCMGPCKILVLWIRGPPHRVTVKGSNAVCQTALFMHVQLGDADGSGSFQHQFKLAGDQTSVPYHIRPYLDQLG